MTELTKLYQFKQGDRVTIGEDPEVFIVGRADGACVNVRQESVPNNCGPVFGWAPAKAAV